MNDQQSAKKYKGKLRRVAVWDEENEQTIQLLTNHPTCAASTIGKLYMSCWQVGLNAPGLGDQTSSVYQILYWNHRQCGYDSDMYGLSYDSCIKSTEENGKIQLVLI